MFKFCECQIPGMIFNFCLKMRWHNYTSFMQTTWAVEDAIPGTMSYHQLEPFSHNPIGAKKCSEGGQYACILNFNTAFLFGSGNCFRIIHSCGLWPELVAWAGYGEKCCGKWCDCQVFAPKSPTKFYHWLDHEDHCVIPSDHILKVIQAPTTTGSAEITPYQSLLRMQ